MTQSKKNLILLLVFILLATFIQLFRIDVINCQIENQNCNLELYKKLDIFKGKSLFFVNLEKTLNSDQLKSETIFLQNYKKKFPATLILNFSQEKAEYQLNLKNSTLVVSEFGNILQNNQKKTNLVQVNWNDKTDNLFINNTIDQNIHLKIMKIINTLKSSKLKVKQINWLNDKKIIIKIEDSPQVIIDIQAIDSRIKMLKLLLNSKEIKDYQDPIKEIDFRFNLPVLRTAQ